MFIKDKNDGGEGDDDLGDLGVFFFFLANDLPEDSSRDDSQCNNVLQFANESIVMD